jgi:hypothetical protein
MCIVILLFDQIIRLLNLPVIIQYYKDYGIYLIIVFSLDCLYLLPRLGLIYNNLPKEYRGKNLLQLISQVPVSPVVFIPLLLAVLLPLAFYPRLILVVIIGSYSIIMLPLVIQFIPLIYRTIQDLYKYVQLRQKPSEMDFFLLLQTLETFNSDFFRTRLLRSVNKNQLLTPVPGTEQRIRNLISYISGRLFNPQGGQLEKIKEIDAQLGSYLVSDRWSINQLDEISILLEEIQTSKHNRE